MAIALAVPKAVIAVLSALHVYGLTTPIPHEVSIALPGTMRDRRASRKVTPMAEAAVQVGESRLRQL